MVMKPLINEHSHDFALPFAFICYLIAFLYIVIMAQKSGQKCQKPETQKRLKMQGPYQP